MNKELTLPGGRQAAGRQAAGTYRKLVDGISEVFERARGEAVSSLNQIFTRAYWEIGRRIVEVEQRKELRAEYGAKLIENLSKDLTKKYGKGFSETNVRKMRQFYEQNRIQQTSAELSWSQEVALLPIPDSRVREALKRKAVRGGWSVRELKGAVKNVSANNARAYARASKKGDCHSRGSGNPHSGSPLKACGDDRAVQLTPPVRGTLYTYKIIEPSYVNGAGEEAVVDVGFQTHVRLPLKGVRSPEAGTIVTSVKREDGSYTFRRTDAAPKELYAFRALIERVVDGDTLLACVDCGFGTWTRQKLRLSGIDTPEMSTPEGVRAKRFVKRVLADAPFVVIKSSKSDKYDRYLADVFYLSDATDPAAVLANGTYLNQELLNRGHARVWG